MMRLRFSALLPALLAANVAFGAAGDDKPLKFAFITDVHVSVGAASADHLRRCVEDINEQDSLSFVIFGGDVTDFGADAEIELFKSIIEPIKWRTYVLAGNHDCNWSESGCNTFVKVFGYEHFEFEEGGWRFLGCNSGPDMRMSPALVPHDSQVWLEGLEKGRKSIFINHYPMDSSVLNWFEVTRTLKEAGVRFEIGGHWHRNTKLNYDGIPAVLGRAGLPWAGHTGYNIFRIKDDHVSVSERRLFGDSAVELAPWYEADLPEVATEIEYDADGLPADYPWMRYDVNREFPEVREVWRFQDEYNIVAGSAIDGGTAFYTTAAGDVRAISLKNGKRKWSVRLPGKIYSTPAVSDGILVVGCSDGKVYGLKASSGKQIWAFAAKGSVVASPLIRGEVVYIGASDGCFRALGLRDGHEIWTYEGVQGHVASTPFADDEQVVFGSWGRKLYSLDPATGREQWVWTVNKGSRMYSPASCVPLKADGKIFVAVPDRQVYAIDARTGEQVFVVPGGRDAIGINEEGDRIFSKTMFHHTYAIDPSSPEKLWETENRTGYEIGPSALAEIGGILLIPACKGEIVAQDSRTGDFLWAHKLTLALINPLKVWRDGGSYKMLATAMDGTVCLMSF